MAHINKRTQDEWAKVVIDAKDVDEERLALMRTGTFLHHSRDFVTYVRDVENIVPKRNIYGNALPLNQHNLHKHEMKLARFSSQFTSAMTNRKDRIWNVRKDAVATSSLLLQLIIQQVSEQVLITKTNTSCFFLVV